MIKNNSLSRRISRTVFMVIFSLSIGAWMMARSTTFSTARNQVLDPKHYESELVTSADYALLNDSSKREVTLSNGSTVIKSDNYESVLTYFRPVNQGTHYLRITTKQIPHHVPRIYRNFFLPMFLFLSIVGMILTLPRGKQRESVS